MYVNIDVYETPEKFGFHIFIQIHGKVGMAKRKSASVCDTMSYKKATNTKCEVCKQGLSTSYTFAVPTAVRCPTCKTAVYRELNALHCLKSLCCFCCYMKRKFQNSVLFNYSRWFRYMRKQRSKPALPFSKHFIPRAIALCTPCRHLFRPHVQHTCRISCQI